MPTDDKKNNKMKQKKTQTVNTLLQICLEYIRVLNTKNVPQTPHVSSTR